MINALMADIQAPGSPGGSHPSLDYRQTEFSSSSARSSFASYLEQISQETSFSTTQGREERTGGSTNLSRQDEFAMREAQQQREAALQRSAEQNAAEEHRKLQADAQAASESRRDSLVKGDQSRTERRDNSDPAGSSAEQKSGSVEDGSRIDTQNENAKNEKPLVNTDKIEDGKSNPKRSTPDTGEKAASESQSSEEHTKKTVQVDTTKLDEGAQESATQASAKKRISAEDARETALKQTSEEGHSQKNDQNQAARKASRKAALKEVQLSTEAAAHAKNSSGENEVQSATAAAEGSRGGVVGEKGTSAADTEDSAKKLSSQQRASQPRGDEKREDRGTNDSNSRRTGESAGRPKLTVIDKRGASARNNSGNQNGSESRQQNSEFKLFSLGNESGSSTGKGISNENGDSMQVMQVNLREDAGQSFSAASVKSSGNGIRNELMQQLQDHLNKDIVKRSSILIRENGSGEIELDLKPDNLGQVRIRITMENNNIAGKIFVENSNVKEAFDQNMQQLYRAFKEHGFENAALNVSVGDQGSEQRERGRSHGPQLSPASQVRALDEQGLPANDSSGELRLIDVMA
ncbi:MAG: flagellar hook-length control protein FliK [Spirochaetia bacterium]|nr:flagellar hook-length control protein FliK [Spirochaetia bacterium]